MDDENLDYAELQKRYAKLLKEHIETKAGAALTIVRLAGMVEPDYKVSALIRAEVYLENALLALQQNISFITDNPIVRRDALKTIAGAIVKNATNIDDAIEKIPEGYRSSYRSEVRKQAFDILRHFEDFKDMDLCPDAISQLAKEYRPHMDGTVKLG